MCSFKFFLGGSGVFGYGWWGLEYNCGRPSTLFLQSYVAEHCFTPKKWRNQPLGGIKFKQKRRQTETAPRMHAALISTCIGCIPRNTNVRDSWLSWVVQNPKVSRMVQRKQSRTRPQQHGTSKWTHSRPFVLQGIVLEDLFLWIKDMNSP